MSEVILKMRNSALLITLIVILSGVGMLVPPFELKASRSIHVVNKSNLTQIGFLLRIYQQHHQGNLPGSLEEAIAAETVDGTGVLEQLCCRRNFDDIGLPWVYSPFDPGGRIVRAPFAERGKMLSLDRMGNVLDEKISGK